MFERLIANFRIAECIAGRGCQYEKPTGRDDCSSECGIAWVNEVNLHVGGGEASVIVSARAENHGRPLSGVLQFNDLHPLSGVCYKDQVAPESERKRPQGVSDERRINCWKEVGGIVP